MANKKQPSYGEAVQQVEEILARLENDTIDVDELAEEVRRAVELVELCREKLQRTELEVQEFVARLRDDDSAASGPPAAPTGPAGDDGALPF